MATASILLGWSLAVRRDPDGLELLAEGLDAYRRTGARMDLAYFLGLQADALRAAGEPGPLQAADEALRVRDRRGYCYDTELHRLRAELPHAAGDRLALTGRRLRGGSGS